MINKNPSAGDADGEIYEASRAGRSWEDENARILKPLHLFCDLHPLRLWTNLCGHNSSALCIDLRLRPRPAESVCESSVV